MNGKKMMKAALAVGLSVTSVLSSVSIQTLANTQTVSETNSEKENIALNKPVTSTQIEHSSYASYAVDGNENTYWASVNPAELEIDLQGYYKIDEMNLMAYFDPSTGAVDRYYEYEIYASMDQEEYTKVAEKKDTAFETPQGDTYTFEETFTARYIKIKFLSTHAQGQPQNNTAHIKEFRVFGELDPDVEQPQEKQNVALGKMAYAPSNEGSNDASKAVDGNKGTYWAGPNPTYIEVDLERYYDIDEITVIPYYGDGRCYHYEVYTSVDGYEYEKVGEKTSDEAQTADGETYAIEGKTARYVKIEMLSNSANPAVHVNEIEVYGTENSEYEPPEEDNEGNIAMSKPTRSYSDNTAHPASAVNDGQRSTSWTGLYYPAYVDIDLEQNYNLNKIVVMPSYSNMNAYYQYSVYTSMDGVNFDLLVEKDDKEKVKKEGDTYVIDGKEARIVRLYLQYASSGNTGSFQEIKVYGEASGTPLQERAPINVSDFEDTTYAQPVTEEETISEVRGVLGRVIGDRYQDWFEFALAENSESDNDYYEIRNHEGKILITGNKGLSLTTGLNHYLKYYCNVSVSQQTRNVEMPAEIVPVEEPIRKETPYQIRYAYNYCTHSYTMAFWGETQWQNELDWLALNGFNAILDITGQEEVWRRFMGELGYTTDEIKDWLVGPGYFGWQYMANMENVNGPIPDNWFAQRTELARKNQRKMRALGMTPILQGYSGMVPNSIQDKDPSAQIIAQGQWNGMQRPAMLKTNTATYQKYAQMFYQAQKEVYGDVSHFYATDPFHEGGNTGGIGRDIVGRAVLDEMKAYDSDAIWVIQSWSFQPELLQNITAEEKQNNILLLDLNATKGARYSSTDEFAGSNWVYCMLENYGGRSGINGNLQKYTTIPSQIKDTTEHMVGMGISPEGTNNNPVKYDLFLEMMWEEEDIDLNEWLTHYIERRYGELSEGAQKAWEVLLETAYQNSSNYADPPESIINARPAFDITKAAPNGNTGRSYNTKRFEKAVEYLMEDYELLKDNEGYLYDLTDLLRQAIANSAAQYYQDFTAAFEAGNKEVFDQKAQAFLDLIDLQDRVLNTNENFMVGKWLNASTEAAEGQDEFTQMIFQLNGKAIISTWAPYYCWGVYDYANREYGGLTRDYYLQRWQLWIERLNDKLNGEDVSNYQEISTAESHAIAWEWARSDKVYSDEPAGDIQALYEEFKANYSLNDQEEDELKVDQLDIRISTDLPGYNGHPLSNAIDGNSATFWSSAYGDLEPYEVFFEFDQPETISTFSILPRDYDNRRTGNGDILGIELWVSDDGESYRKIAEGQYPEDGEERRCTFEPVTTKYVKLVITDFLIWNNNHAIKSVTAGEFNFYRPYAMLESDVYSFEDGEIKNVAEGTSVAQLRNQIEVSQRGSLQVMRGEEELDDDAVLQLGDVIAYYYDDALAQSYEIKAFSEPSDFSALNALIAECEKLNENDYTSESWKAFSEVLTVAIGVQVNPEATQEEIDEATADLKAAMADLVPNVDLSGLRAAILEAEALTAADYTKTSWDALAEALAAARTIAEDQHVTQAAADQAASALRTAMAALQIKASDAAMAALQNIVDSAQALQNEALSEAIAAAKGLLADPDNASTTAVVTALLNLSEAIQAVNTGESTDALRADVQATIDFIKENILTNVDNVRPGKVDALEAAVEAAQTLVDDPDASADSLKAANKAMTKAAQELWQIVSKAELEALIEAANGYTDGSYTAESIAVLQDAITNAQATANNDDATTAEVTDAIMNLANAIAGLEQIMLDTSALAHEINLVTEMVANIDDYVPFTVEGLADKLAAAQAAMNATTQEEIDAATATLREARLNARTKADISALAEIIAYANSLNLTGYTAESRNMLDCTIFEVKKVLADPEATQEKVDEAVTTMQDAIASLVPVQESTDSVSAGSANTAAALQTGLFAGMMAAAAAAALHLHRKKQAK